MLSYEFLKSMHIVGVLLFFAFGCLGVLAGKSKLQTILFMVGSLVTLVFGLALVGALKDGMQYWMIVKMVLWLALMAASGIISKRFSHRKEAGLAVYILLAVIAVVMVVYKPF